MTRDIVKSIFVLIGTALISLAFFQFFVGFQNRTEAIEDDTDWWVFGNQHHYSSVKDSIGKAVQEATQLQARTYTEGFGVLNRSTAEWDSLTTLPITCDPVFNGTYKTKTGDFEPTALTDNVKDKAVKEFIQGK